MRLINQTTQKDKTFVSFVMSRELREKMDRYCAENGQPSRSALIRAALQYFFAHQPK